jgi:hypothetical protein
MRGAWLGLTLVALLGGSAVAAPLKVRNGSSVRVALHGKREPGVGLRAGRGGWRVELGGATPTDVAEALDVTDGANGTRWTVDIADGGALVLDEERFIAGHAYRITVRRGTESIGTTLVYLYPPAVATRHKVTFDDADTAASGNDIAITKKPTL